MCATELPDTALFHCQQAAEKYLKAYLTWNQAAFRKTHELKELAAACALIDPALQSALEPATALSKYAWQFRYPGAPYEPDAQEAATPPDSAATGDTGTRRVAGASSGHLAPTGAGQGGAAGTSARALTPTPA